MRFKINLHRPSNQRMLSFDYQYYISAWIYKVLQQADEDFATFLHQQGYGNGNKHFKLFNYSPLYFGKPKLWKEKSLFEITTNNVSLQVSFYLPDAAERFIVGLFNNQQVFIGDKFNGINFTVSQIERMPEPLLNETVHYKAFSPVVVSLNSDDKYATYLSPDYNDYALLLKSNLNQKINTLPNTQLPLTNFQFDWQLTGQAKSKLITIKPGTPQQSKVRGYKYPFTLTASPEIHQFILSTGLGEKNSTGFGWCEVERII